jgi:hypothetical protein
MKLFSVKDTFGELHTILGEAVTYVEHGGQLIEARIVDAEGRIVAAFKQWHYIKEGATVPPPSMLNAGGIAGTVAAIEAAKPAGEPPPPEGGIAGTVADVEKH